MKDRLIILLMFAAAIFGLPLLSGWGTGTAPENPPAVTFPETVALYLTGSDSMITVSAEEYIDFLKRTDLGSQYPKERFKTRIKKLVRNVSISLIARNETGLAVGVLFGLTDYCYWLYVTDLGVDRDYLKQGIATRLMKTAHEIAGGEKDIAVYLIANEDAVPFYEKIGMKKADDVMQYNHIEWTEWTV